MTEAISNEHYFDAFSSWLGSLGGDAGELALALDDLALPERVRLLVAGSLNYLFKSLDLIPDGVEDLGYLDDALVLRVAARLCCRVEDTRWKEKEIGAILYRLAGEADLVETFLGPVYQRLERYTEELTRGAARGRTAEELVKDVTIRTSFLQDVTEWASRYENPSFTRDEKILLKFHSFLDTKLPK